VNAAPYSETFANVLRAANIAAAVAGVLGSLALLLACVGIYGVAAYNVSQRTREIGVRMALGAHPSRILGMILRQNLRTVAAGVAVGVAGAIGFAQLLKSILYGLAPTDPVALAATLVILASTAVLASWAPAQRAATIDPSVTLRQD
jgi:ABC-type antimicrobial peptide transport system permease subunit